MESLIIPKGKKIKCLYIFCNKCKAKKRGQLKPNEICKHPADKQVFKAIVTIPFTKRVRTKTFSTRNIDNAINETLEFEKELKESDYQKIESSNIINAKPIYLESCIYLYLDYLENINVYDYQKKIRSDSHKQQITTYLKRFEACLKSNGIDFSTILVRHINKNHVQMFHSYIILQFEKLSHRTYNRHMDTVSEFFNFLIEIKQYELVNYFSSKIVKRKSINSKIDSIPIPEFNELMNLIKTENGIEELEMNHKMHKNHYYPWIKDAFELGLFSGRRRDEIVNMKFSDIKEIDGLPIYIETEDYKYNLRNNLFDKSDNKKFNYTPVIADLYQLLIKMGYNEFKGTDRYLIAPDSKKTRNTLKDDISKSFTFYYGQLKTGKNLSFKHLRKTYITMINNFTNGLADNITGHSGQAIILKNYHDQKVFNNALQSFKIIS